MSLYSAVHKFIEDVKKDDAILDSVESDSDAMLLILKAWLIGRVLPETLKDAVDNAETPSKMSELRRQNELLRETLSWAQSESSAQEERASTLAASAKMLEDFNNKRFDRLKEEQEKNENKHRAELRKLRERIKKLVDDATASKDA